MKKILTLFIAILFFYTQSNAQTHYFKFNIQNKKVLKDITRTISIDDFKNNTVWAYANDEEFNKFSKLGYKIEELPLNDNKGKAINMATTVAQMANWDRYPTYSVYTQMMQDFATNYPAICKLDTISNTQNGKKVLVLKISDNVNQNEPEPEFFYTSTMHGDETTGFVLMLRLADYLLSNYGTDTEATDLVNNFEIFINPLANPDGTYYGGDTTVIGSRRELYNGDDPNRDYPYPLVNNTSRHEETIGMENFASAHHFVMSANFHGGSEVYNYPWDCWTSSENTPTDASWWEHIGHSYVDSARLINSSYMTSVVSSGVTEGADWYYAYGSRQDYMNYFHHCKEVTVELSNTKILSSDQLPAFWNYNERSLINYIKEASYGFNGTVKNTNGDPLNAKIEITALDKDSSNVVTDPANGDYYRPIAPGTYDVTYSSYGYISQTISVTVTDWETTTVQNVVLLQDDVVNVTGTVTEEGTGNPLENVKIEFLNTSLSPVYTDASGNYTVPGVVQENNNIDASKSGYTAIIKNVNISTTNTSVDFILPISNPISFENNVPSIFTFGGNLPWVQVTNEAYDRTNSMKSGAISNNQTSVMETELNIITAGDISFYKKVSSEYHYDYFKFYIDGVQQGPSWSGELNWSQETFHVTTTGIHTFKWIYSKDGNTSSGSDCAWVDYIEFPQYEIPPTYTVTFNVTDGTNPVENAAVTFNAQNKNTDAGGHAVFTEVSPQNNMTWSVSKTGYNSENGTLNVVDADANKDVVLTDVTYTVTFNVVDASSLPIEAANVNFNSQDILTDATGKAIFNNIPKGNNLPYIISKSGFLTFNGTLNVNSNINQTISLTTVNVDVILKLSGLEFTPNPFKDFVSIQFYSEEKANTIIYIYSYSGQLVKSINIGNLNAGNHEYIWNASGLKGEKVKNGIYFIKIQSGNNTQTGKLILVN